METKKNIMNTKPRILLQTTEFDNCYITNDLILANDGTVLHDRYTYLEIDTYTKDKLIDPFFGEEKNVIILKPLEKDGHAKYFEIMITDKDIDQSNELETMKYTYELKLSRYFDTKINTVANITYYKFTVINNKLADRGFFITNENREEKYIEILETEDEDLINDLEIYLICKDEIERASAAYEFYYKFKQELQECDNKEELENIASRYLTEWTEKAGYQKIEG